jgi:TRAP-type mannitol/chloroaromatic compound transport system permease small subunit
MSAENQTVTLFLRSSAWAMVALVWLFLLNNFLIFWMDWPGILALFAHQGWFGVDSLPKPLMDEAITLGWFQIAICLVGLGAAVIYPLLTRGVGLRTEATRLTALVTYLVRALFWAVLLVGIVDAVISFLRVEDLLIPIVGKQMTLDLGRNSYRGTYVHYPMVLLGFVIALFMRGLGFVWLALLVVVAQFSIVITRFIFSYEQAFMGDLVRFWYAALFLFGSAYALISEGHVRVDVLYTHFSARGKAWANGVGSIVMGLPLCWVILTTGMWGKGSSLNNPLLSFEVSQQGYGMYVKYLMVGFLVTFSVTMSIQFMSSFLESIAELRGEAKLDKDRDDTVPSGV